MIVTLTYQYDFPQWPELKIMPKCIAKTLFVVIVEFVVILQVSQ